jgi:iron complex outermembrane receptor protein
MLSENRRFPLKRTAALLWLTNLAGLGTSTVWAQSSTTGAGPEVIDTVIVTGTRATGRVATESVSPVDVITADKLQSLGVSDLGVALSKLLPSISTPRPHNTVGSEAVKPVVLRGLAPDQVLVLIDGKRRNSGAFLNTGGALGRGTSPVDLGAIPVSAIERIEVLRDGATARYGSDAIAGVVNVILKKGAAGATASVNYGGYTAGDGLRREAQASVGLALGDEGWIRFALETQNNDFTNRSGPNVSREALADGASYGKRTHRVGAPALKSEKFAYNAQYTFNSAFEVYSNATITRREVNSAYGFQYRNAVTQAIRPLGYLPEYNPKINDEAFVIGARGDIGDEWRYDGSVSWGHNAYKPYVNTLNASLYRDTGSTPFNFYNGRYDTDQTVANLSVSRDFDIGWFHDPLSVTIGVERQQQKFKIGAGDPASYYGAGAVTMPGISPENAGSWSRNSTGAFIDLETRPIEKLTTSVALRSERYSDFGNALAGSLAARYDATKKVALRGSVSNGFRAPSLTQSYYSSISSQGQDLGNNQGNVVVQSGTFPVGSRTAQLLGAKDLKAEKSISSTLGLVLRPDNDTDITIDAYRIDINNRINLSSNFPVTGNVQRYLEANGVTGINYESVRYLTNAVDTRTDGIDLVAQRRWTLNQGDKLATTIGYSFNKTKIRRIADNPAILSQLNVPISLVERREIGQLTVTNPRHKVILSADYAIQRIGVDLHGSLTRFGSFDLLSNGSPANDQRFKAKWTTDLAVSYTPTRQWRLTVGVENLFDVRPDKVYNNDTNGSFPYTSYSPLSADGRFLYATARYIY